MKAYLVKEAAKPEEDMFLIVSDEPHLEGEIPPGTVRFRGTHFGDRPTGYETVEAAVEVLTTECGYQQLVPIASEAIAAKTE